MKKLYIKPSIQLVPCYAENLLASISGWESSKDPETDNGSWEEDGDDEFGGGK